MKKNKNYPFYFESKMICTFPRIIQFMIFWSNGTYNGGGWFYNPFKHPILFTKRLYGAIICWNNKHLPVNQKGTCLRCGIKLK